MPSYFYLSSFYFFYFGLLGALLPYLGLYLRYRSFDLVQIAELMSLLMATKIFAPIIWGWWADRSGYRLGLIRVGAIGSACSFTLFYWADSYWSMFWAIALFSFFWNAILAQYEVITMSHLGSDQYQYGQVRLWGSIGFVVLAALTGMGIELFTIEFLPSLLMFLLIAISIATWMPLGSPTRGQPLEAEGFVQHQSITWGPVILFYGACVLLQVSHGAYYTYFSLFMSEVGYRESSIGFYWALGVIAEVVLFILMPQWLKRSSLQTIIFCALLLTSLRWLLLSAYYQYWFVVILIQILHAFSFGAMHAASIQFVYQSFPFRLQGRAQAFYSALSFGLGGALGASLAGFILPATNYASVFLASSAVSLLAAIMVFKRLNK